MLFFLICRSLDLELIWLLLYHGSYTCFYVNFKIIRHNKTSHGIVATWPHWQHDPMCVRTPGRQRCVEPCACFHSGFLVTRKVLPEVQAVRGCACWHPVLAQVSPTTAPYSLSFNANKRKAASATVWGPSRRSQGLKLKLTSKTRRHFTKKENDYQLFKRLFT